MSLEAESELLATDEGRRAVASGLFQGIRAWLAERPLAVRYDALVEGGEAGVAPPVQPGDGPPFAAPGVASVPPDGLPVRLTNTGNRAWPAGLQLLVGVETSDAPYLASPPAGLQAVEVEIPALQPGESVILPVPLEAGEGRSLAWVTLADPSGEPFSDLGSPALQVALQP
jgi:hypothetical protein